LHYIGKCTHGRDLTDGDFSREKESPRSFESSIRVLGFNFCVLISDKIKVSTVFRNRDALEFDESIGVLSPLIN